MERGRKPASRRKENKESLENNFPQSLDHAGE
jgi:hypothetical protein